MNIIYKMDKKLIKTSINKCDFYRDFKSVLNERYTNWLIYHDESLKKHYSIKEDLNTLTFNTSNIGYEGKSLNHLNRFLSEACGLLYPWMNDLRSDYIGFRHYRRWYNTDLNSLSMNLIDKNYYQYFHFHNPVDEIKKHREEYGVEGFDYKTPYKNIENHCFFWSIDKCGFMDDIIDFLSKEYPQYLENEKHFHKMIWGCMFVCNWDMYIELCEFMYSYIKYVNDKYNLGWNENSWYTHVYTKFMRYNQEHHYKDEFHVECRRVEPDGSVWCELPWWGVKGWTYGGFLGYINRFKEKINLWRVYAYNIEFLVSLFIYNHLNIYDNTNNPLFFIDENGTKKALLIEDDKDILFNI